MLSATDVTDTFTTAALVPRPRPVLILEDDLCLKTTMTRLLQNIDPHLEPSWHTTAERAIDEVNTKRKGSRDPYDLVIADISTPGSRSGLDLWQIFKLRFPEVPFLFISGMPVDRFLRILGSNALCPPFLPKPFTFGECRQIVEGLLKYGKS